ncbi:cellulose synthase/poly-beta-1,6-N-acetylglucosamine synthase-like glycosyltransferase [Lutibacter sp. Hel_I_33_5]|uniref:glycosyltransferase n=1 Tax=Lutibacter sp. Hel_I_33_5 TaxID=1566289 RepID=UPI00119F4936|nr:glycosyltransferase [Lutibacter sp. Hel_I_33_5]TVZ55873.1 cellulose synthase/poly-beta-1,6-N-acetylglucosamine synthase-like glycosyltransferase [Lutibacter sp. Hel_I_33_5]
MIWALFFILFLYGLLILSLGFGFVKLKKNQLENKKSITQFSIIIPFRNESEKLPILLESISKLRYPKELFEIIFVDDDSTDDSVEIINCHLERSREVVDFDCAQPDIRIIKNKRISKSPKKDAITTAIGQTKFDWIITTDADCILLENWLQSFDEFIIKNNPNMIVAPVNYKTKDNFLDSFQLLDFMSMQGSTIGGFGIQFPFMCNGANLCYKKELFKQLNGFDGNNHIASGDDVFLFEKFLEKDKNGVKFLKSKDAIVTTFPVNSWTDLIHQRVRWAAKTGNFKSGLVKFIGLLVLLINLSIVISFFGWIFQQVSYKIWLFLFASKFIIDLFLFLPTIKFYEHNKRFYKWYLLSSLCYPFFSILVIFKSVFSSYHWKGRSFKK